MVQKIKLSDYINTFGENWADSLPEDCPPEDVCIAEEDVFFRFTTLDNIVTDNDWISELILHPSQYEKKELKIYAAGLSLFDTIDSAVNKLKLPFMKKKFKGIASILLVPEDGVLLQTFYDHHYTWWRTNNCNLSKAQLL